MDRGHRGEQFGEALAERRAMCCRARVVVVLSAEQAPEDALGPLVGLQGATALGPVGLAMADGDEIERDRGVGRPEPCAVDPLRSGEASNGGLGLALATQEAPERVMGIPGCPVAPAEQEPPEGEPSARLSEVWLRAWRGHGADSVSRGRGGAGARHGPP